MSIETQEASHECCERQPPLMHIFAPTGMSAEPLAQLLGAESFRFLITHRGWGLSGLVHGGTHFRRESHSGVRL